MQDKISQYIEKQFPEFYREEGQNFIAFMKAYYEWLEQPENSGYKTKHLLQWADVDSTIDQFILYFKEKYLKNIQFNTESNKKLLIKNATDLYRTKGTERSIDLFFKLVYGVDAEVQYPSERIFKLSDGDWETPYYLEITYSTENINYIGKQIIGSVSGATAFVEKYIRRRAGVGYVNLIYISNLVGEFIKGEDIGTVTSGVSRYTTKSARVIGSIKSVTIIDKGNQFAVGDTVSFNDSFRGVGGLARVTEIGEDTGIVDFILLDGGWGYSLNSESIVSERVLVANNIVGNNFALMDTIIQPMVEMTFTGLDRQLLEGDIVRTYDGSNNVANGVVLTVDQSTGSANGTAVVSYRSGPFTSNTYYLNSNSTSFTVSALEDVSISGKLMNYPRHYDLTVLDGSGFTLNDTVYSNTDAYGVVTNVAGNNISVTALNGQFSNGSSLGNTTITNVSARLGIYEINKTLKSLSVSDANTPSSYLRSRYIYQYGTSTNTISSASALISSVNANTANVSVFQLRGNWNPNAPIETVGRESDGVFTYSQTITGGDFVESPGAQWVASLSNTTFIVDRISDGSGASFAISEIGETESVIVNTDFLAANTANRRKNAGWARITTLSPNASSTGFKSGDIVTQTRGLIDGINVTSNLNLTTGEWTCTTTNRFVTGSLVTYLVSPGNTAVYGLSNGQWYMCNVINSSSMTLITPENGLTVNSTNIPNFGTGRVNESGHKLVVEMYGRVANSSGNTTTIVDMWPPASANTSGGERPFAATSAGVISNVSLASNPSIQSQIVASSAFAADDSYDVILPMKDLLLRTRSLGFKKLPQGSMSFAINDVLTYEVANIGIVASISAEDGGSDYNIDPEVLIINKNIQALNYHDYSIDISNTSTSFAVGEKVSQTLPNTSVYTYQVNWGVFENPPASSGKYVFVAGDGGDVSNTDDFIYAVSERQVFNASYDLKPNEGFITLTTNAVVGDLVRYFTNGSNAAVLPNNTIWRVKSVNSTGVVLANTTNNDAVAVLTQPNTSSFSPNTISNSYIFIPSNPFANDVVVRYVAETGNTPVLGITSNTTYYVVNSNSSALRLSSTMGGSFITLTAGPTESGHSLVLYNTSANGHNLFVYHNDLPNGYRVQYLVNPGNTVLTGLSSGAMYYVTGANSSGFKVTSSVNGSAINISSITGSHTDTSGHYFDWTLSSQITVGQLITSNAGGTAVVTSTYIANSNLYITVNNVSGTIAPGNFLVNVGASGNTVILASNLQQVITVAEGIVRKSNSTNITVKRTQLNDLWDNSLVIRGESTGATANITRISPITNTYPIGLNADIDGDVITAEGQVASLEIVDSGYGYTNNEIVQFVSEDGLRAGTLKTVLGGVGLGKGYYRSSKGFLSDEFCIQDGDYYQEYSYEVFTKLSVDKYSDMFKKVMHTAGTKFFGSVMLVDEGNTAVTLAESSVLWGPTLVAANASFSLTGVDATLTKL